MNSNARRIALPALLSLGLLAAAGSTTGCMSGGGSTKEHKSLAQQRLNEIKSATEFDMARQAFLSGDLTKAADKIETSLAMNPQVAKSHVLRGRIMLERGIFDEAMHSLEMAQTIDPQNVEAYYYQGIIFERLADREEALAKYLKASSIETGSAQFIVAAAEVFIDLGRDAEAYQFLDDVKDRFEHNAGVRQTMGHLAFVLGNYSESVENFRQAQLLAPDDLGIVEDLARSQIYNGDFAEAEYNLARLLDLEENFERRDLKHLQARCLMATDRVLDARTVLLELTGDAEGSSDVEAWAALGQASYKIEDFKNVRRSAARLQAIAPSRHEGFLFQALFERSEGKQAAAIAATSEALKRKPDDFTSLLVRGMALFDLGKFEYAQKTFAYTQERFPESTTVSRALAAVENKIAAENGDAFAAVEEPRD